MTSSGGSSVLARQLEQVGEEEDLRDADERLALWFLRYVLLVDDLDAYDYVDPSLREVGIDAFYLRPGEPAELVLIQIKHADSPVRAPTLERHLDQARQFQTAPDIRELPNLPIRLRDALTPAKRRGASQLPAPRVRLALVVDAPLTPAAEGVIEAEDIEVYRKADLERYARALETPALVPTTRTIEVGRHEWLVTSLQHGRALICPVPAGEIVQWPGIADRTLFDFNVRYGLGHNRVRASLDAAISAQSDHPDFLAYHNGLTVLCDHFDTEGNLLTIHDLSVVNGAQSVLALAEASPPPGDDLRLIVKFVEVRTSSELAREIAIRSNTQNPVTARNLRALDPLQLAIQAEFAEKYPDYRYDTRPGVVHPPVPTIIANDSAAQLLCAVYNEKPWLAVKRDTLFQPENYRQIFAPSITAAHVLLCHLVRQSVESAKSDYPELYRRSWRLTAIVATYLVGQLLRTNDELRDLLQRPASYVEDSSLEPLLNSLAGSAAQTLTRSHQGLDKTEEGDDFKVNFKRETFLRRLAEDAVGSFVRASEPA